MVVPGRTLVGFTGVVAVLALSAPAFGAEAHLWVDSKELIVGQRIGLHLQVADGSVREVPELELGAAPGLEVAFVSRSSRTEVVGFKVSSYLTIDYVVTAQDVGRQVIGPVEVALSDGSTVKADAIGVTVNARPATAGLNGGQSTLVEAGFESNQAWEGQVLLFRYRLKTREEIRDLVWKLPDLSGFRDPGGEPTQRSWQLQESDGSTVQVVEATIPVLATTPGDKVMRPTIGAFKVLDSGSSPLGFRTYKSMSAVSDPQTLHVKSRPKAPEGYSGLVGDFVVQAMAQGPTGVAVGDSVPIVIRARGNGSLEGWSPKLSEDSPGLRVYTGGQERQARVLDKDSYEAVAAYSYTLVPTAPGTVRPPPLSVVVFSPSKGRYETISVPMPTLQVSGDAEAAPLTSFGAEPSELPEVQAVGPRPAMVSGCQTSPAPLVWLSAGAVATGFPGVLAGLAALAAGLGRRMRARAERRAAAKVVRVSLAKLPADDEARWALLAAALAEVSLAGASPERVAKHAELSARLNRVRFAGEAEGEGLSEAVRAFVGRR